MRNAAFVAVGLVAVVTIGCGGAPGGMVASTAWPGIRTPVGPVPGPPALVSRPVNPHANDKAAQEEGRHLFVKFNCSGCHGDHGGGGMGPSLRDQDWLYGATDAQVFSSIAEGRAHGMPTWAPRLTDDQMWELVAYIKTLRTPDEVQPPR